MHRPVGYLTVPLLVYPIYGLVLCGLKASLYLIAEHLTDARGRNRVNIVSSALFLLDAPAKLHHLNGECNPTGS